MKRLLCALLLGLTVSAAAPASAQGGAGERARLEQQVRERLGRAVRQQLQLTDDQARRLQQVNQRYEEQRNGLVRREREARMELRRQVLAGDSADQARASVLLDTLIGIQRRRVDLVAAEQRDLAQFLTPVQRAKYLAMQDQMRRRVEEFRRRQGARRGQGVGVGPAGPR